MQIEIKDGMKCIRIGEYLIGLHYARQLYKWLTPNYISTYKDPNVIDDGFAEFYLTNPNLDKEVNPLLLRCLIENVFQEWFSKHRRYFKAEHTNAEWEGKLEKYSQCVYCGSRGKLTKDHIVPIINGGSDKIDNIVPACMDCNRRKGALPLDKFLQMNKGGVNG